MKKYKLKKDYDTPGMMIPAGTVGTYNQHNQVFSFQYDDLITNYRRNVVESTPDWFEEVKEELKSDVYEDAAKEIQMMALFSDQVIANTLREKYIVISRTANTVSEADRLVLINKILNP